MGKQGGGKQKWVAKDEVAAKEAAGIEKEEKITSPILLALPSTGPKYERLHMCRLRQPLKDEVLRAPGGEALTWATKQAEDEESGDASPSRGALRAQKKAEKALRKGSSNLEDIIEDGATSPKAKVSLAKELKGDTANNPWAAYAAYMQQYVANMWNAMPQVAGAGYTTIMLRNIPNRYTRDMLAERLNQGYEKGFDFVYLPIDFNSKCNVGYAFINFRTPALAQKFFQEFHGSKTKTTLPGFTSAKVCEVSYARVQGRDANMDNLRDEKFIEKLNEHAEWQPLFYDEKFEEIPFAKMLEKGRKRTSSRGSGSTPTAAGMTPTGGYMMPPFGMPMMPPFGMGMPGMIMPTPTPALPTLTGPNGVLKNATTATMLMVRGVPASWDRVKAIAWLNKDYKTHFDFLFLPGEAKGGEGNRGFMFVNFRKAEKAKQFTEAVHEKKVSEVFGADAVAAGAEDTACDVQGARLNSVEKSVERTQGSVPDKGSKEGGSLWLPLMFASDGEPQTLPLLAAPPGGKQQGAATGSGAAGSKSPMALAASQYQQTFNAVQAAHMQAHASAAKHAGYAPGAAVAGGRKNNKPLDDEQKANLRKQIEYYFSSANLCKDVYLRKHMDTQGWTPVELIAQFPQVKKYGSSVSDIRKILADSELLEVDGKKGNMRLKNEEERNKWASVPDSAQKA